MSLDNDYAFELDFLPVGDGERSGDAIAMRWQQPDGFYVAVVDGGTKESGEQLIEHVRRWYGATFINLVINTHPDQDHASGLQVVLEKMPVLGLWMHRPWMHPEKIRHLFANQQFTTKGLSGRIKAALDAAYELEQIAKRKNIPITEPYEGLSFGPLLVLSPSQDFYLQLVPHFQSTPEARFNPPGGMFAGMARAALYGLAQITESWGFETLREDGFTSPQNESSVVLYARFSGRGILLTGDAGQQALARAYLSALGRGIDLAQCRYYQVPHHGSRRNVSPKILDALLGPKLPANTAPTRSAIASVGAASTSHPRRIVCNAFRRRGVAVASTKGATKYFYHGYPLRPGYHAIEYLPFFHQVENYD